ncbi:hypothetical protein NEOLEDRAFT_1074278 [Neolentinus lepideus HHB14362 ss-1]|uniref:J domain-containing protein n=1 Tax=Neolentinus lepideus HHB14362 ss-1 TaxID=1314782 RepID=A0A165PH05_9AGAM|nr:hypothetical protein NEOLEDRAFT_1074278 [Neolentinus lepideus HHB14362 ss-1]
MHLLSTRLQQLPHHLLVQVQVHVRLASTSKSANGPQAQQQFSFPAHPNPTPHQIFHLPAGASQSDIKARYYDLVRVHHPDSPSCRHLDPSERHARFQSIRTAYDILTGKQSPSRRSYNDWSGYPYEEQLDIMRRHQWARTAERERRAREGFARAHHGYGAWGNEQVWTASPDDRWKDRVIITFGVLSLVVGLAPVLFINPHTLVEQRHLQASANLAQARRETREFGWERRREVRRRVQEHQQEVREEQLAEREKTWCG